MPLPPNRCTASTIEHLCIIAIPAKGITQQIQTLKVNIMLTFETHGQEIRRLHLLAQQTASDAIEYARTAGMLLLEVKKGMKHGKFLLWVRDNARVSLRQAQRYMAVAQGKTIPLRRLIEKSDTMSHLDAPKQIESEGKWIGERWEPEQNFVYCFADGGSAYWVSPSIKPEGGFHICKHYKGPRISSEGLYWRYTILAAVTDPEVGSDFYMGTRFALCYKLGIHGVLNSYGLNDLKNTLVFSCHLGKQWERPFCEPETDSWYWNSELGNDELAQMTIKKGWVNQQGAIIIC